MSEQQSEKEMTAEKRAAMTPTDCYVELMNSGGVTDWTGPEGKALKGCTGFEDEEFAKGYLPGTCRVALVNGTSVLVVNAFKICEGLIQGSTPTETEASIAIPLSSIACIKFTQ